MLLDHNVEVPNCTIAQEKRIKELCRVIKLSHKGCIEPNCTSAREEGQRDYQGNEKVKGCIEPSGEPQQRKKHKELCFCGA